jgi:hypothetical protein
MRGDGNDNAFRLRAKSRLAWISSYGPATDRLVVTVVVPQNDGVKNYGGGLAPVPSIIE